MFELKVLQWRKWEHDGSVLSLTWSCEGDFFHSLDPSIPVNMDFVHPLSSAWHLAYILHTVSRETAAYEKGQTK